MSVRIALFLLPGRYAYRSDGINDGTKRRRDGVLIEMLDKTEKCMSKRTRSVCKPRTIFILSCGELEPGVRLPARRAQHAFCDCNGALIHLSNRSLLGHKETHFPDAGCSSKRKVMCKEPVDPLRSQELDDQVQAEKDNGTKLS